jgi:hypothetical protein
LLLSFNSAIRQFGNSAVRQSFSSRLRPDRTSPASRRSFARRRWIRARRHRSGRTAAGSRTPGTAHHVVSLPPRRRSRLDRAAPRQPAADHAKLRGTGAEAAAVSRKPSAISQNICRLSSRGRRGGRGICFPVTRGITYRLSPARRSRALASARAQASAECACGNRDRSKMGLIDRRRSAFIRGS